MSSPHAPGVSTASTGQPPASIAGLDGIRGIAVLMVLLAHLPVAWFQGGIAGVDVFFVLSGFLITTTLLRGFAARGRGEFGGFYFRRILRLWPPLALCLVLAGVLWDVEQRAQTPDFTQAALAMVFNYANWRAILVPGNSMGMLFHAWSLSIEEQFYLLWPVSLWLMLSRGRAPVPVLLAIIGSVWVLRPLLTFVAGMSLYLNSLARMDALLIGCIVAILQRRDGVQAAQLAWLRRPGTGLLALGVLAVALFIQFSEHAYSAVATPVVGLASAALITQATSGAMGPVRRLLEWAPLTFIGRRSYGIYLYHLPIFLAVNHFRTPPTAINLVTYSLGAIALTVGVACLSFAVEEPLLRWGKAWLEQRARSAVRAPAAIGG